MLTAIFRFRADLLMSNAKRAYITLYTLYMYVYVFFHVVLLFYVIHVFKVKLFFFIFILFYGVAFLWMFDIAHECVYKKV